MFWEAYAVCVSPVYAERNRVDTKLELPTRERVLGRKKGFTVCVFSITQISRDTLFANGFMACSVEVNFQPQMKLYGQSSTGGTHGDFFLATLHPQG